MSMLDDTQRADELADRMSLDAPGVGADNAVPKADTKRDRWLCALYGLIRHTILWFVANGRAMLYEAYRVDQSFEREGWKAGFAQEIEEVVRATAMRPMMLNTATVERVAAWEKEHRRSLFGRQWTAVAVQKIPGGVYPEGVDDMHFIVNLSTQESVWVLEVPGREDEQLDFTGLLTKKPGKILRWMPRHFRRECYETYHVFHITMPSGTKLVREVRVEDGDNKASREFLAKLRKISRHRAKREKSKLGLQKWLFDEEHGQVQWTKGMGDHVWTTQVTNPRRETKVKPRFFEVQFKWRRASMPKLIADEVLEALPTRVKDYQELMGEVLMEFPSTAGITTERAGALTPVQQHAYGFNQRFNREVMELETMRTSVGRIMEGKFEGTLIHHQDVPYRALPPWNQPDEVENLDVHGRAFEPNEDYDTRFTPRATYFVSDSQLDDKVTINITMVTLAGKERVQVGTNAPDSKVWPEVRQVWASRVAFKDGKWVDDKKRYGVAWLEFKNALAWLIESGRYNSVRIEHNRILDTRPYMQHVASLLNKQRKWCASRVELMPQTKVTIKKPGAKTIGDQRVPKRYIDSKLWINWETEFEDGTPMATAARIFGVPVHARSGAITRGKPLAVWQLGYISKRGYIEWQDHGERDKFRSRATQPRAVHQWWHTYLFDITEEFCEEVGLNYAEVKEHAQLEVNVMNELPSRKEYKQGPVEPLDVKPKVKRSKRWFHAGCYLNKKRQWCASLIADRYAGGISCKQAMPKEHKVDFNSLPKLKPFDPAKNAEGQRRLA